MFAAPGTQAEILNAIGEAERRSHGVYDRSHWLDELARRRHLEDLRFGGPRVLAEADLRRFERIAAEHRAALRASVRAFRAALRLPDGPRRSRAIDFARDAVQHNRESLRIWSAKAAEVRARLFWRAVP